MSAFELAARVAGVCALVFVAAAWRMRNDPPLVPLTLAATTAQAKSAIREGFRTSIDHDRFFIIAYTLMFLGYAVLHWLQRARGATVLAIATAVFTIATMAFDLAENRAVLHAIDVKNVESRALYAFAALKFLSFFVVLLLSAPLFMRTSRLMWIIGALFVLAGAIGLIASVSLGFTAAWSGFVGKWLSAAGGPLLIATVIFLFRPSALLPLR
ncbi:MAG TPA: hypothetical protein VNA69_04980 [Thermoanaerobaculia bacterium]|nr:hypothetical protein [Thermoanaerobaculia bacterium]